MMEFMRKNSKYIMVFFGVLIMIGFVLPSALMRGSGRRQQNVEVGTYAGVDGTITSMTNVDLGRASTEVKVMLDTRMPLLLLNMGRSSESFAMLNPASLMLTSYAVFGDNQSAYITRNMLVQSISTSAKDKEHFNTLLTKVDKLIDSNQSPAINYLALKTEANRNGFYATTDQVAAVVSFARQVMNQQGQKMSAVLSNYGMTIGSYSEAVANVIAIANYADNLTKVGVLNENAIRDSVRDSVEINNMSGKYVEFTSSMFTSKVEEPKDEELVAHFEQYKDIDPQDIKADDKDNPFGFSYMLPDRLKVEYIDVDVSAIKNKLKEQFEAKNIGEQEETLQEYWTQHKTEEQYQQRQPQTDPDAQPEYKQKSFDEAYNTVKNDYLMGEAKVQAESIIAKIREAASNENDLVEANIDWEGIAAKNSNDILKVKHGISEFLSMETISSFEKFSSAKLTRLNDAPLSQMLFSCEPLRDRPATKLEQPPLKLRETLANIEAGYGKNTTNMYIVRIVAVDKSRVANSIDDDGRQGSADIAPLTDGKNVLKDKVKADLKKLKAYNLAKAKAEEFKAALAGSETDLAKAIETIGKTLMDDPEAENARNPLAEKEIQELYSSMEQMRNMIQQNEQYAQYFQSRLSTMQATLKDVLDAYREVEEGQKVVVENTDNFSVLVFEELNVEPANQDDLAKRKSAFAVQTARNSQVIPMIDFFLHDNIIKRNAVEMKKDEDKPEDEAKEEAEA